MEIDQAANTARKNNTAKRLDFYHDVQLDYISDHIATIFSNPDAITPCFVNIVKKFINSLAAVYARDAVRELKGSDKDVEFFQAICQSSGLSVKMKAASRYVKLCKTVLIRPVWRKGSIDLDILTGDVLDVTTGDTPEDLQAVMITHYPESGKQDEVEYSVWTAEAFKRLDYLGNVIKEELNPYNILPFLPVFDRCPTSDFWLSGGDDLINAQEAINEKLTDLLYIIRMQGFGVGWIRKGKQTGASIGVNPGTMVELPEDGAIGFESQKAPIKEIISAIEFLITQVAVLNGLSASTLSTKTVRESGLAKVAGSRELEELRRDDIILWRRYEQQLFELIRIIWNVHNPSKKFSEQASINIDFYDPKPEISPKDQAETWASLIDLGVLSPVDVAMERNPELRTREEAKAALQKIKEENALFKHENNSPAQA
ncbi:MAG: hypothetical protein C4518_08605 [Desulfobacteraceae bacterium]|nr:MAG: hypothetical protein C4518_08605 [Desulfobacteraceae bacterium]